MLKRMLVLKRPVGRALRLLGIKRRVRTYNAFATHLPILVGLGCVFRIENVLELGCGRHSTLTFLNRSAFPHLKKLDSFETDSTWKDKVRELVQGDQRVRINHVTGQMSAAVKEIDFENYELVFIDDSLTYEERARTIALVASRCAQKNLVLIHDYESPLYQQASAAFGNRYAFTALTPHTGLAWNAFPVDVQRLQSLSRLLERHARRISPEDLGNWIAVIQREFCDSSGKV
jgi:hypothetical protein